MLGSINRIYLSFPKLYHPLINQSLLYEHALQGLFVQISFEHHSLVIERYEGAETGCSCIELLEDDIQFTPLSSLVYVKCCTADPSPTSPQIYV